MKHSIIAILLGILSTFTFATEAKLPAEGKFSSSLDLSQSLYSPEVLQQCLAGPNCNVYNTPHGVTIRFTLGMEPGSQDYKDRFSNTTTPLSKTQRPFIAPTGDDQRVSQTQQLHSRVTFGDNSINYGTINPCDAVHHLFDMCHEGDCDTNVYQVDTQDIADGGGNSFVRGRQLSLYADGQYDGWWYRDQLVNAIVASFSHGQSWNKYSWKQCYRPDHGPPSCQSGDLFMGRQSNFIGIATFDQNGAMHGHMSVRVEMDALSNAFCLAFMAVGGAIAKAINKEVGQALGFLSLFCT